MGNICRSPTAEGVFRGVVEAAGLQKQILIDSAGTHAFHAGAPPDSRARAAAERRGIQLSGIRARPVHAGDFEEHDYILAMDLDNLQILHHHAGEEHRDKVRLFLEFSGRGEKAEVPDPYYGGASGFERVLDLVEEASRDILETLRRELESARG